MGLLRTIYYYGEAHTDAYSAAAFILVWILGYSIANLINLENADVLFCCITHHTSHTIYLEKLQI